MNETPRIPTEADCYLFDLRGYIVIEDAISQEEVDACNRTIDELLPMNEGEWDGHIHCHVASTDKKFFRLQQIYEAGEAFESLIDHPSWIEYLKLFVGGEGTFDWHHGPLFIDENTVDVRGPSKGTPFHSGGHEGVQRTQYRFRNGRFHCGQVNVLLALTDMMPGDGATMIVPGSHKSHFPHPEAKELRGGDNSVDGALGAVEVNCKAGDAVLFVDAVSHGSARRVNGGERRICIYRYGPSWGNFRYGYRPSPELLERLTPQRRQIVQPLDLLPREPQRVRRD